MSSHDYLKADVADLIERVAQLTLQGDRTDLATGQLRTELMAAIDRRLKLQLSPIVARLDRVEKALNDE